MVKCIFVSPHHDDAIMSCGALIANLTEENKSVIVYSMFSGLVSPPYSKSTEELHKLWGNPSNVIEMRRLEDQAAAEILGATVIYSDQPEAIYRKDKKGNWNYLKEDSIFMGLHDDDLALIPVLYKAISSRFQKTERFYFPLGIGNNVDHIISHQVGMEMFSNGYDVVFYEDFPYADNLEQYNERINFLLNWTQNTITFNEQQLIMKIKAIEQYKSQIPMLFKTDKAMHMAVINYAIKTSCNPNVYSERYWYPPTVVI